MRDSYRTLGAAAEFRQKIERSDFLGLAIPVSDERDFFTQLNAASKRHFDATHHCWAFRLFEGERSRRADAGEPSGTAGRPILSAIEGADLFDVAVIVVRWFGGVKLGTGGLGRAYRDTAVNALRVRVRCATLASRRVRQLSGRPPPHSSVTVVLAIRSPVRGRPARTNPSSIRFQSGTISGKLRTHDRA